MSKPVRNYQQLASDILEAVGGEENIVNVARCATRLRLVLKRSNPEFKRKVSELTGVITVVENGGQFQIVIGQHVGEVYDAFTAITNVEDTTDEAVQEKGSILNRVIATMSAVFAPFIYILAAAGILQGTLILINLAFPAFEKTGTYEVFSFISWAPFTFLPIFIALTAAKHFKVNIYIALACAMALVSPTWTEMAGNIANGETIRFFGIPLSETVYTSTVLPPLFLVWVLSYVERFLNKVFPEVVKALFVPLCSIVIMVPLTLLVIGPLSTIFANGVAGGYNYLAENLPILAAIIIGAFWQIFVIFGVHWGITPVVLANFDNFGRDSFQAYQTIAVIAQVGSVLGVFLKAKAQETKKISLSAGITGIFGITEPAIYGVNLRFKKPFIIGCISGAIGAVVASFFNPYYYVYAGLPGPLTIVNTINSDNPSSFIGVCIGVAIAIILPIVLIQIFGYGDDSVKQADIEPVKLNNDAETTTVQEDLEVHIQAPLTGDVIVLSDVADPVFSSGAMGDGLAIKPTKNEVVAPVDGSIVMTTPSKHAIGIRSNSGIEILIHVGMDTVQLNGEHFELLVQDGDAITAGQPLLRFDAEAIEQAGYSTVTPVIITNHAEFNELIKTTDKPVAHGDNIIEVIKK
ncbi:MULTISPECIES: beta-glucoside-specific PTS transporter subunit IIABC [unclassified Staphylococcus]|uniref:beta-glucoside-specific PTS transporter subunit IIABC n=1 Tax=unclassified Staphylococcus TaxID=91994 RepID=UPI0021D3875D|nr:MULTISPECIES: beta-glucoside-specific PTS transporter subunit IIABC [unclassified Staphylococcus]UXR76429.1 beta-glucoside-specific PTS transporter subunit IIABC [Staphylococcus sp. IVB6233]UXR80556.1 beta-glucoside-specific PTS transporter subunit IIABC [Staphylococcus sp. IVB6218]